MEYYSPDEATIQKCKKFDQNLAQFMTEIEADFHRLLGNAIKEAGSDQGTINQMFVLFFYGIHNTISVDSKISIALQTEYAPELQDLESSLSIKKELH